MKNIFLLALMALSILTASGQSDDQYTYYVDLTSVQDDRVPVLLEVPKMKQDELVFYMPKIIPGTYSIADYGRFISDFKAFDKKGKELSVEQRDVNTWVISNAKKISTITYKVDDSFDYEGEGPEIFWPAGTNIEADDNFVINTAGFFGYFEGKKKMPFEFNIIRANEFYGGTGLIRTDSSDELKASIGEDFLEVDEGEMLDKYTADDYDHLVDSPLMYAKADTAIINVSNTEVIISSYSPNGMITAKEIAATIEETLMAQNEFLGGKLPVDKYAFIFHFTDLPVQSYGALEHSYSSMYFIPESTVERLEQTLRDFAAHEFFHIITPLTIHSEEIGSFDFNEPEMSKHLWLYEGVTEYFAGLVQVKNELIPVNQYFNMLREKLAISSNFLDTVAFTTISKGALGEYEDQYYNVYQKGALIGMCLDLMLLDLSDNEMNLRDLVLKLSETYGKNKSFKDDELFDVITEMSYPEIGEFLETYVGGDEPINYSEFFEMAGIMYRETMEVENITLGIDNSVIGLNQESGKLFIRDTTALSEIGKALDFQQGDLLVSLNGKEIPPVGPELQEFFGAAFSMMKEGEVIKYGVLRKTEDGIEQEIVLETENKKISQTERFVLVPNPQASPEQMELQKVWLSKK